MQKELNGHLDKTIIAKANELGISLCLPAHNELTTDVNDDATPEVAGICIGSSKDGKLRSYIKGDDDSEQLQLYIDNNFVVAKTFTVLDHKTNELYDKTRYFMLYHIAESSANVPTCIETTCGNGTPLSGYYDCKYEILVGDEDHSRRFVFHTKSVNISMYEYMQDLEDLLDSIIECDSDVEEDILSQFFYDEDENVWKYTMFDEVGIQYDAELNANEFLSIIKSIRQIACEYIEDNKSNA